MQKIFSSMMAAMGRQLKQSVNVFHSLMLYRRLPAAGSSHTRVSGARAEAAYSPAQRRHSPPHQEADREHRGRPLTLVVKAVDAVDARALVIAAQNEEVLRVLDLVGEQKADGLERLLSAVDVVTAGEGRRVGRGRGRDGLRVAAGRREVACDV
jgi:hypothetical protein